MPIQLASVLIVRRPDGHILCGRRTAQARSWHGYCAFPGGGAEPEDAYLPLLTGATGTAHLERACALRELGEESGLWSVAQRNGMAPSTTARAAFAEDILAGGSLHHALFHADLVLDDRHLTPLSEGASTARSSSGRFFVRAMLLHWPESDDHLPKTPPNGELDELSWRRPAHIEQDWQAGKSPMLPSMRRSVDALVRAEKTDLSGDELLAFLQKSEGEFLQDGRELREIINGLIVEPFRSPTLPPATTTNAVFIGDTEFVAIDPASVDTDEQERFDNVVERLQKRGRRLLAVVLTHHHHDHMGDAARVAARFSVPIWAHAETARAVPFVVNRFLDDSEEIILGTQTWTALHTPGHARGHLCFYAKELGALVAGDMIASEGSILIDPDEGHIATYLASLTRLAALSLRCVVPSHGPALATGTQRLVEQIAHRHMRNLQVEQTLRGVGNRGALPLELVSMIYGADVVRTAWPLAERSLISCLQYLVEQGRATQRQGRYFPAMFVAEPTEPL